MSARSRTRTVASRSHACARRPGYVASALHLPLYVFTGWRQDGQFSPTLLASGILPAPQLIDEKRPLCRGDICRYGSGEAAPSPISHSACDGQGFEPWPIAKFVSRINSLMHVLISGRVLFEMTHACVRYDRFLGMSQLSLFASILTARDRTISSIRPLLATRLRRPGRRWRGALWCPTGNLLLLIDSGFEVPIHWRRLVRN